MVAYIDTLQQWQWALDKFANERVSQLSRKTWKHYISSTIPPTLWGKTPAVLEKEIKNYQKKPRWLRGIFTLVTPIRNKEKLWLYYRHRQALEAHVNRLSVAEKQQLQLFPSKSQHMPDNHPTDTLLTPTVPTNFLRSALAQLKLSLHRRVPIMNEADSRQWRGLAENALKRWAEKKYYKDGRRLRALYDQFTVDPLYCNDQETMWYNERKNAFYGQRRECEEGLLSPCLPADKKAFRAFAKVLYSQAERELGEKVANMALDPTVRQSELLLQERYLKENALAIVPYQTLAQRLHLGSYEAGAQLDLAWLKKRVNDLQAQLPRLPDAAAIALLDRCYDEFEQFLREASRCSHRLVIRARDSQPGQGRVQEGIPPIEETIHILTQCFRQVLVVIHPDKADPRQAVQKHAEELFKKLDALQKDKLDLVKFSSIPDEVHQARMEKEQQRAAEELKRAKEERRQAEEKCRRAEQEREELRTKLQQLEQKLQRQNQQSQSAIPEKIGTASPGADTVHAEEAANLNCTLRFFGSP